MSSDQTPAADLVARAEALAEWLRIKIVTELNATDRPVRDVSLPVVRIRETASIISDLLAALAQAQQDQA